jgi:hypothetical protein
MYIENNKIKYIIGYRQIRIESWVISFHKREGVKGVQGEIPSA